MRRATVFAVSGFIADEMMCVKPYFLPSILFCRVRVSTMRVSPWGAVRWSGREVWSSERVDDDRLASRGRGDAGMSASIPVTR